MDKAQKKAFVEGLNAELSTKQLVVIGHYRGCTVAQMEELRNNMRNEGGNVQVAKNRLANIAFKGTQFEGQLEDLMTGPTVITMSEDAVVAAKIAQKFADKTENFAVIGGALGEKKLSVAEVEALAKLPSLDELRGKLVGLLQAPAGQVARIVAAPASGLARQIAQKPESSAA